MTHKEVPKEGWIKAFRWVKDCDMQAFPEHVDDELIPQIRELLLEARREGAKGVRSKVCDEIYDAINEYVGSPDNPDYQMPDGEKIIEIIDIARTAGEDITKL